MLHSLNLLKNDRSILEQYQQRFKYILVDEYQDTNSSQYLWLRLLAQSHKNICCVGDDDQSIYSWRGAEVANILKFEKDFPNAKIVKLEQNYRSTPHILAAASALIDHNSNRLGKTLWTEVDEGEKVQVVGVWDGPEEARRAGDEIEALQQIKGVSLNDIAILVRAQFQTREFEDRFISIGMPYKIIGGFRFYERAEIRDALAYLRVIAQPADDLAFERIVNTPKARSGRQNCRKNPPPRPRAGHSPRRRSAGDLRYGRTAAARAQYAAGADEAISPAGGIWWEKPSMQRLRGSCSMNAAIPPCCRRTNRPRRGTAGKPDRTRPRNGGI